MHERTSSSRAEVICSEHTKAARVIIKDRVMVMADGLQRDSHHCVVEVEPICLGAYIACVVPILHGTVVDSHAK